MNKLIDADLFQQLYLTAEKNPRKRSHHNLHPELSDPVQRLCIGLEPGTYVRPHRHPESYKWEMMLILSGSITLLLFDDKGGVTQRITLSEHGPTKGIELPPNTWHTVFPANNDRAVTMEIKQGPYTPTAPESFADWAPEEGGNNVARFLSWAEEADVGDRFD